MRDIIEQIATGPELSKNISEDDAYRGMMSVLNEEAHDVQSAIFLIALRMKRETPEENRGVLKALLDTVDRVDVDTEELVDIADPYNGLNRGLSMSPFLPAVLAACGVPCISTGVESVAPKYGVTHYHVLKAASKNVDCSVEEAKKQIEQSTIGWCYLDQSNSNPKLHRLRELRKLMVKRSCVTTCEVLLRPLSAKLNHLVTGYVHKAYPPVYFDLAQTAGYQNTVLIKGVEGSVMPSMQTNARFYKGRDLTDRISVSPEEVDIHNAPNRAIPNSYDSITDNAKHTAELGLEALSGALGEAHDSLVFANSLILFGLGRVESVSAGAALTKEVLSNGEALNRFQSAA